MTEEKLCGVKTFKEVVEKGNFHISDKQRIEELEKEIDYYKSRESHWDEIEEDAKIIAEENAELRRDKTELVNSVTELENKVTELEKQIDKMKCCGNCKHEQDSNTDYYCEDCKRFAFETKIEKWECKEW